MKRLNNAIREQILNSLLAHRFDEEEEQHKQDMHQLAVLVYDNRYDLACRKTMAGLPNGFLPSGDSITIDVDGCCRFLKLSEERLFMYTDYHGSRWELPAKLLKMWRKLQRKKDAMAKAKNITRRQAWSLLRSTTTVEKLRRVWPEVTPFIPEEIAVQLPAVITTDLNKLLRLP